MTLYDEQPEQFIRDGGSSEMHLRRRIPVGILGATGSVGQKLVELIEKHPWFEIVALAASENSQGKQYGEVVQWRQHRPLAKHIAKIEVTGPKPDNFPCQLVFSALDTTVAGPIEEQFRKASKAVISCTRSHRMDPDVPLVIPEVNGDHLELVKSKKGFIVTKPNCAVTGLMIALRPLMLEFGIEAVHVVTMQAISGAGFPGLPSVAILDNIIPYIAGEEERFFEEPQKIFGSLKNGSIAPYPMTFSTTCTRVPVTDGHLEVVSVKFKEKPTQEVIKRAWREFSPPVQELKLPSACRQVIHYFEEENFPQPKLHRDLDGGMAVSCGRLRPCPLLDFKFVLLSHNTIRGAAGGALLIAEQLIKTGYIFW